MEGVSELTQIITGLGSSGVIGGILFWAFKSLIKSVDRRLVLIEDVLKRLAAKKDSK